MRQLEASCSILGTLAYELAEAEPDQHTYSHMREFIQHTPPLPFVTERRQLPLLVLWSMAAAAAPLRKYLHSIHKRLQDICPLKLFA